MANTSVFTGSHGTLTLASLDTPEGQDAESIISSYETQTVGRVTDIEICVQTDLEEFHEIGRRFATSLTPGNVHISGKVGRAFINGALIGLLLGQKAFVTTEEPFVQPAFNMVVRLSDPAVVAEDGGAVAAQLVINGVKFQNWSYHLPEDDFVVEQVTFKALSVDILDAEGAVTIGPIFIE